VTRLRNQSGSTLASEPGSALRLEASLLTSTATVLGLESPHVDSYLGGETFLGHWSLPRPKRSQSFQ
jgi:hypothetical protein